MKAILPASESNKMVVTVDAFYFVIVYCIFKYVKSKV